MRILSIVSLILVCLPGHYAASGQARVRLGFRPHVLVYKTKADYRENVPVQLSADKKEVVSYPGPGDVKTGSSYMLPVLLHKGYLLDKRGIGKNTAFIRLTYKEYSELKTVPSAEELYKMIIDKNPIKELYDCGTKNATKNSEEQLNHVIDRKQLKKQFIEIK